MPLKDAHGRAINYVRLSVTDRCNLRCSYCMPASGLESLGHGRLLGDEEFLRLARAALDIGVEKIRITGGEPLVRPGIVTLLERIAALSGLRRLVVTTNGILLKQMARDLRSAGVESLNISLDSLKPETFAQITRGGRVADVMEGIDAAVAAGFPFLKLNMVVLRGINDAEVADFAALTLDRPYRVRFIEYMPTLHESSDQNLTVPGSELLEGLSNRYSLEPVDREPDAGPSVNYRIQGGAGTLGIITPVSCHFCNDCNRIRIASDGMARSCLFSDEKTDLKPSLERGDMDALRNALVKVVASKPEQHRLLERQGQAPRVVMSQIGG